MLFYDKCNVDIYCFERNGEEEQAIASYSVITETRELYNGKIITF
jgi:hypothetical protein